MQLLTMKRTQIPKGNWVFTLMVWPWLKLLSILPFAVLYVISDLLYLLLYRIIGYRTNVVRENLERSFPEKTSSERKQIEIDFYKHLGDLFVETIKGMSISSSEMKRRMANIDQHHYDALYQNNQSAIIVMSHCGNWEWICLMSQIACQQRVQCVYKSLSNSGFDRWMYVIRSKFGANPIPMEQTLRVLDANKSVVTVNAFIGDQNPSSGKGASWTNFLNQDTPFMMGPEKIAKKFDMPLYYLSSRKVRRGFYEATTVPLCLNPKETVDGEITQLIAQHTEREIQQQPHIWLWSHRRWKHKRNA
jgi:KDO2-lipid IV(A) lauroyltransferase